MGGGTFIDDGEGHEWADALGHFPWKSDDGVLFRNLMSIPPCASCGGLNTSCPDGCGRDPLTGELNGTRFIPDAVLQRPFDVREGRPDAPTDVLSSFHAEPIATNQEDNPRDR